MGKRFRETNISREAWYRKLSPVYKCAWNFLCDECDVAGVWSIDDDALVFFVGEHIDLKQFMAAVNSDKIRVEYYGKDKLFIPGFIEFQYGQLSEHCKPHQKIISLLKKYQLLERVCKPYTKGMDTLQEEEEDKEEEKEGETEKLASVKKIKLLTPRLSIDDPDPVLKTEYDGIITEVNNGLDIKQSWIKIKDFIDQKKPHFVEPFVDVWNIFATHNNLTKVNSITPKRRTKFKVRIREPEFEFIKILDAIRRNDFYLGKGNSDWKVDFDFIIHSQDNYIKIIERRA